jgi:PKHD-type hydroxylase
MFFFVENLLQERELAVVQKLVRSAEYVDGRVTADSSGEVKRNAEMAADESYLQLLEILDRAIERSNKLEKRLLPRYRVPPIINKYEPGMFFREHVDAPIQGGRNQLGRAPGRYGQNFIRTDYSMTLFLNDPSEYDGGELELKVDERPALVKLPAGSAVCYQTGIPHSVRPVSRGSRIAAIYWFQSLIRDPSLRRTIWDLDCLSEKLKAAGNDALAEEADSIRSNFIRYLAEI